MVVVPARTYIKKFYISESMLLRIFCVIFPKLYSIWITNNISCKSGFWSLYCTTYFAKLLKLKQERLTEDGEVEIGKTNNKTKKNQKLSTKFYFFFFFLI